MWVLLVKYGLNWSLATVYKSNNNKISVEQNPYINIYNRYLSWQSIRCAMIVILLTLQQFLAPYK